MTLESMLACLEARAPYLSVARPILLAAGFTIHQGFPNTIDAALHENADPARDQKLASSLIEHMVAGEKLVRLVKITPQERATLESWVVGKRRVSNALTDPFPGIADPTQILSFVNGAPSSLGSASVMTGSAALFTAVRAFEKRVPLSISDLKPSAGHGFNKLIGVLLTYRQTHEAVWVPPSGEYACLCTDLPPGVPKAFANASQAFLLNQVTAALGRKPVFYNLWKAVDGLYGAPDGKLVDYGFSVAGEQVNHHKARRKQKCLRKTVYDAAGATAVGDDLELFKVAMEWAVKSSDGIEAEPEALLPGVAADLNRTANIDHAIIRGAINSEHLAFVINKLLPHI